MKPIDLPLLPAEATLRQAGAAMHEAKTLAVVTRRHGSLIVLTQEDMHRAVRRLGKRPRDVAPLTLENVTPSHVHAPPRHQVHGSSAAHHKSVESHAHRSGAAHTTAGHPRTLSAEPGHDDERSFEEHPQATLRIVEEADQTARVVTRHEGYHAQLSGVTTRGICRDPAHDKWWPFELATDGICNFDDAVVDF